MSNTRPQYCRNGSRKNEIIKTLCMTGAIPYNLLAMNKFDKHSMQMAVREMEKDGVVDVVWSNGKKRNRRKLVVFHNFATGFSVFKKGLPEGYLQLYKDQKNDVSKNIRFGIPSNQDRLYSNIETQLMFHWSDIPTFIEDRPDMSQSRVPEPYAFYASTDMKSTTQYEDDIDNKEGVKKINGSRSTGIYVSPGGVYTVYNIGKSKMKFMNYGELKMKFALETILHNSGKKQDIDSCVILYRGEEIFEKQFSESDSKNAWNIASLDSIYEHIYMIPVDEHGREQLQIIGNPIWREQIINYCIAPEIRNDGLTTVPCDGYNKDTGEYTMFFGIVDTHNLRIFVNKAEWEGNKEKFHIICFDYQQEMFERMYGKYCDIRTVSCDDVVKETYLNVTGISL